MMNWVWAGLLAISAVCALAMGKLPAVVTAITESAGNAVKIAFGLAGVTALWLGLMRIAEDSGLIAKVTGMLGPLMRILFPRIPSDHPALASITMNMVANMFGLNNAATPLGIKAMQDLQELNPDKAVASDEMCMFLALNTSSVQLIPAGAVALLAGAGAKDPTAIILPALLATTVSTLVGFSAARLFARRNHVARPDGES